MCWVWASTPSTWQWRCGDLSNCWRSVGTGYVCLTGVHGVMEAQSDPELREILNRAFLCLPDGMPTVWVGQMQGHRRMRRVYGPDFMMEMCRQSRLHGYRHFLYGGAPGVAEQLETQTRVSDALVADCGHVHSSLWTA